VAKCLDDAPYRMLNTVRSFRRSQSQFGRPRNSG